MKNFSTRLAALGFTLGALASSAQALTFVFTDVGTTPMTSAQMTSLQQAGNYWSSKFTDNVTIYIDVNFASLGTGILGSASSSMNIVNYSTVRSRLVSDASSAADATAVSHLQSGSALSFWATQADMSTRFDNNGSGNNTKLLITTANAKAIGLNPGTSVALADASLTFSNNFPFSFTRAGGTPSNQYDFQTVAEHEIGHALGFISGVDSIDSCEGAGNPCNLNPSAQSRFESDAWYTPLDLFRSSTGRPMDVTVGGNPYFSIDGGVTAIETFSTGDTHGNGWQASHFGTTNVNLMRPFVGAGQSYDATTADLTAFDVIGWNLVTAVPEPRTYALLLGGLAVIGWARRRRMG